MDEVLVYAALLRTALETATKTTDTMMQWGINKRAVMDRLEHDLEMVNVQAACLRTALECPHYPGHPAE